MLTLINNHILCYIIPNCIYEIIRAIRKFFIISRRRRRPGDGRYCNAPRPSICQSRLVFALQLKNALLYFLETLQVRAPSHGVCCIVFYINGMFAFFKYWKKKIFKKLFFQNFMFSSCFMLFPTLIKKMGVKNPGYIHTYIYINNIYIYIYRLEVLKNIFFRKTILSHFTFYAIFNIKKILKSSPSLTG